MSVDTKAAVARLMRFLAIQGITGEEEAIGREIARRAGVSHAALAYQFGDKAGIFTAIATEGFRLAGYECLYANDCMPEAIQTFQENHPAAWADGRKIEDVNPHEIRSKLQISTGEIDVLVGGPPCQGFSINAPERFLKDPRNKLFKDYVRFLEEFQPKAFLFENVPGLLSLGDGKVLNLILGSLHLERCFS